MEYGAIDLHKKESQIRIVTERGEVVGGEFPIVLPRRRSDVRRMDATAARTAVLRK